MTIFEIYILFNNWQFELIFYYYDYCIIQYRMSMDSCHNIFGIIYPCLRYRAHFPISLQIRAIFICDNNLSLINANYSI